MKPRKPLVLIVITTCLAAWWQVENRLSAAREINRKLAIEAMRSNLSGKMKSDGSGDTGPISPQDSLEHARMLPASETGPPDDIQGKNHRERP